MIPTDNDQRWVIVGPPSTTSAKDKPNIGSCIGFGGVLSLACWLVYHRELPRLFYLFDFPLKNMQKWYKIIIIN